MLRQFMLMQLLALWKGNWCPAKRHLGAQACLRAQFLEAVEGLDTLTGWVVMHQDEDSMVLRATSRRQQAMMQRQECQQATTTKSLL